MADLNLQKAGVGIKRCGQGWHGFIQFDCDVEDDVYVWVGPHRATEDEALQDAWDETQREIQETKELTGFEQTPVPHYRVN